jgi:hypothetical protein
MRELDEGLWVQERPLGLLGIQVGARMTVVRLEDGGLFVHSPVALDDYLRGELDALGPVRHVVAPNQLHHLFVGPFRDAYPDARFYAAPGLREKRSDLSFDAELGDEPPPEWRGQIDQQILHGIPRANEVVFLHRASRTLILTDSAFNVFEVESLVSKLLFRLVGVYQRFGPSKLLRRMVRDPVALRRSIDVVLRWDFERVIVSHGIVLQRGGPRMLRAAWAWLEPDAPETSGRPAAPDSG